jgi:hypothetical protein
MDLPHFQTFSQFLVESAVFFGVLGAGRAGGFGRWPPPRSVKFRSPARRQGVITLWSQAGSRTLAADEVIQ